jgi:tetratricopeptide (TPR) repeat protein
MEIEGIRTIVENIKSLTGGLTSKDDEIQHQVSELTDSVEWIHLSQILSADDKTASKEESVKKLESMLESAITLFERMPGKQPLIDLLFEVGKTYSRLAEPNKAAKCYQQILRQLKDEPNKEAEAMKQLGHLHSRQDNWDEATEYYTKSINLCFAANNMSEAANIYNNLGYNAAEQGLFEQAKEYHIKALEIAKGCDDLIVADAHNSLAIVDSIQGNWDVSIDNFEASINSYEKSGYERGMAQTYHNLAMAYVDCEDFEAAGECYDECTQIAEQYGDMNLLSAIYINRAEFFLNISSIDMAKIYCQKGLEIFRQENDKIGIAEAYKLYGRIYKHNKDWDSSSQFFADSIQLYESCQNPLGMAEANYEFALMHADKQDKEQTKECLLRSKELFTQLGATDALSNIEAALQATM